MAIPHLSLAERGAVPPRTGVESTAGSTSPLPCVPLGDHRQTGVVTKAITETTLSLAGERPASSPERDRRGAACAMRFPRGRRGGLPPRPFSGEGGSSSASEITAMKPCARASPRQGVGDGEIW